jgi:hypothetical protein
MFEQASCATEVLLAMKENLKTAASKKSHKARAEKAMKLLDSAAALFEDCEMLEEADKVTKIMEKAAKKISKMNVDLPIKMVAEKKAAAKPKTQAEVYAEVLDAMKRLG